MLGILVLLLKIILWIFLGLLGLLLALLMIILWVPIRYNGLFNKGDTISASGSVTYLFRLLRVSFEYRDDIIKYKVKVLFFTIIKEGYDEAEPDSESKSEFEPKSKSEDKPDEELKTEAGTDLETQEAEVKPKLEQKPEAEEEPEIEEKPKAEIKSQTKPKSEAEEESMVEEKPKAEIKSEVEQKPEVKKKAPVVEKQKAKRTSTGKQSKKRQKKEEPSAFEQLKRYYRFFKASENRGMIKFVFRMIGKMLKSILPRRMSGRLNFGTDDPALTGYIVGVVSVFYPIYQDNFILTPDFIEPRLEGHVKASGRIIIGALVFYAVRIILDKRVRRLIKEVRSTQ